LRAEFLVLKVRLVRLVDLKVIKAIPEILGL
jgi:hypothetical protein